MGGEQTCPLCGGGEITLFARDERREYHRCGTCELVFVPEWQRPSREEERARYETHRNSPEDEGYRDFLRRLFEPVNRLIPAGSEGLDFGCGPGPTLNGMFEEAGHPTGVFDPFFAPDQSVFARTYRFITLSEVAEHLFNPMAELDRLWGILRPGGVMGIMTSFVPLDGRFEDWYYTDDITHVCFYCAGTFGYIANRWGCELELVGQDVACLVKPG